MSVIRNPNFGSSQRRQRKRRLFFVRLSIIIFLALVVVFGLAILSGQEKIKIQTITISGNALVSSDDILAIARRDIEGRYFYLFAKSNSLIFPRLRIKADILKEIKTIDTVEISWVSWQKIAINIIERKPHSVWCGNDAKSTTAECYLVDKTGYIYNSAPVFSGDLFIKSFSNISTSTSPVGSYFSTPVLYPQIFDLISLLTQNNIKVIFVYYDNFDFYFTLEIGPVIIFNTKNSLAVTFQNFFTAVQTKSLDLDKDAELIKYIDLRFTNKIVIGKKGEPTSI